MFCDGERKLALFHEEDLPDTHRVFAEGAFSPISQLIGLPVRILRLDRRPSLSIPRDYDNQLITYLMIDPVSGFAPLAWQQGIGTVIVARDDRRPLTSQYVEALWMYADALLDRYSEGLVTPNQITQPAFDRFWRQYDMEQQFRPEWTNPTPVNPYEV